MFIFAKAGISAVAALFLVAMFTALAVGGEQVGRITADKAREVALAQTGGGDVVEMDRHAGDGGQVSYRFEIVNDKGAYEVEIDGLDGSLQKFIKKDRRTSAEVTTPPAPANSPNAARSTVLTYEQALTTALGHTGGGTVVESEIDTDRHGRTIYEFEILNNGIKHEIDIDAVSGAILKAKQKMRR